MELLNTVGAIVFCGSRTLKAEDILEKHRKIQVVTDPNDSERIELRMIFIN